MHRFLLKPESLNSVVLAVFDELTHVYWAYAYSCQKPVDFLFRFPISANAEIGKPKVAFEVISASRKPCSGPRCRFTALGFN